jgi:hypothetical protein
VSTNTIDLGVGRDIGAGDPDLELVIIVTAALTGGTSVAFSYITSAAADLSSPQVIVTTPAIVAADLVAGSEWLRIQVPTLSKTTQMLRYIGVNYTIVGTFSAGTVSAGVMMDRQVDIKYTSGLRTSGF